MSDSVYHYAKLNTPRSADTVTKAAIPPATFATVSSGLYEPAPTARLAKMKFALGPTIITSATVSRTKSANPANGLSRAPTVYNTTPPHAQPPMILGSDGRGTEMG